MTTNMTVVSPEMASDVDDFTIPDLVVDSAYTVCVVRVGDVALQQQTSACNEMRTIPMVRLDTILAILLTVALILFLVLTAYICWRCAVYTAGREDDKQAAVGDSDDGKKVCNATPTADDQLLGDEKAPLLIPGSKDDAKAPNNDQQQPPTSLYLFLAGPALEEYK